MYDVIIVGCGPAGLTAGIYLRRAGKKVLILEKDTIGGQMASSPLIENYPGYEKISGNELALKMYEQATNLGVDIEIEEVLKIEKDKVITEDNKYIYKTLIIATGAKYRKLGLPNEDNLIGAGIHFCALCDGSFYKDKIIAVVGGGNSAAINSLYLSQIASKVYLIYRKDKLKCEKILEEKLFNKENIEILYNTTVQKLNGQSELESIIIKQDNENKELKIDGLFESIGMEAETKNFSSFLDIDENNYLIHDNTRTKYDNVFVAGDCTKKDVRQITTAINDGATAAIYAINYLNREKD